MVYPLMNSLIHNMVSHEQRIVPEISMDRITFEDSAQRALDEE